MPILLVQGPYWTKQGLGPLASSNWPWCPVTANIGVLSSKKKKKKKSYDTTSAFPASENKKSTRSRPGALFAHKKITSTQKRVWGRQWGWYSELGNPSAECWGGLGLVFTLPASVRWNRGLQRDQLNGNCNCIVVVTSPFSISIFYFSKAIWSS